MELRIKIPELVEKRGFVRFAFIGLKKTEFRLFSQNHKMARVKMVLVVTALDNYSFKRKTI